MLTASNGLVDGSVRDINKNFYSLVVQVKIQVDE
jgi:hypothetical protein